MSRFSVKLRRTGQDFYDQHEIEAADQAAAEAAADALATAGGGGFDAPEVAPAGGGSGLTQAQADLLYAPISVSLAGAWPIGAVFISVLPTSPATLLGFGTWAAFGAGRVLVGVDSGDTDFDTAEETGGAKTVAAAGAVSAPTITVDALAGGTRKGGTSNPGSIIENGNVPTASASAPTFTGSATSVVQPYIVVYFWKRTA